MGRIHDALKRAEGDRERVGGAPAQQTFPIRSKDEPASSPTRKERSEQVRSQRRSRVMLSEAGSVVTEEYRSLRARIQSLRRSRKIRSLVVTSARPGEGKTTTATNLAMSFGLSRETSTCLIDADMRTPSVHEVFPERPMIGLAELLDGNDLKLEDAFIHVPETGLSVIPVRALPSNPSELLGSPNMTDLMIELTSRFDTVIIDAPPVLGLPDTTELVDLCDATLLVVAANITPRAEVEAALERINADKVLGTVLNRCEAQAAPYGYVAGS